MKISIIGAGTMGLGIAVHLAAYKHEVNLVAYKDKREEFEIQYTANKLIEKRYENKNTLENLVISKNLQVVENCDMIIECIIEDLDAKKLLVSKITKYINEKTIIASNTSSLLPSRIFEEVSNKERILGLHFFNPVFFMKLVEISKSDQLSEDVVQKVNKFAIDLDKTPVLVKESSGYIVNRLLIPYINEACKLIDEGVATIDDIDSAMMLGANHPIGPLKLSDMIGNEITLEILKNLDVNEISTTLLEKVKSQNLGRKTGKGFYTYNK